MCSAAEKIYNSAREIAIIDEKKRTAASLSAVGFSEEKIAEVLKVSVDNIKKWLAASAAAAL